MSKEETLRELGRLFDQLDDIRAELVAQKEKHIEVLEKAGLSYLEALKDWQTNFGNILNAMDSCNEQIRKILHGNE